METLQRSIPQSSRISNYSSADFLAKLFQSAAAGGDLRIPQFRERVFVVGHFRGNPRPEVFPFRAISSRTLEQLGFGRQGNRIYSEFGLSITLAATGGGRAGKTGLYAKTVGGPVRKLTPRECERLQGFPEDWTAGIPEAQRLKCLGNAVTVNVVVAIVSRLNVDSPLSEIKDCDCG